jgi:hypothetical protein
MHTYRFHAQPNFHRGYGWPGVADLTVNTFTQALAGAIVKQLVATPDGGYDVHLAMNSSSHEQALEEVWGVLQQDGYNYIQAVVTEWVTSTVEGAGAGCLAGAGLGSTTKNVEKTVLSLIIGRIVGGGPGIPQGNSEGELSGPPQLPVRRLAASAPPASGCVSGVRSSAAGVGGFRALPSRPSAIVV